jgi:hypothetical protein
MIHEECNLLPNQNLQTLLLLHVSWTLLDPGYDEELFF